MGVDNISDISHSAYGTAIAALENARKQKEQAAAKAAHDNNEQSQDLFSSQESAFNGNEIIGALTAKGINPQIDEENGIIYVKLDFNDGANREFIKGMGFKWNGQAKSWFWKQAA